MPTLMYLTIAAAGHDRLRKKYLADSREIQRTTVGSLYYRGLDRQGETSELKLEERLTWAGFAAKLIISSWPISRLAYFQCSLSSEPINFK